MPGTRGGHRRWRWRRHPRDLPPSLRQDGRSLRARQDGALPPKTAALASARSGCHAPRGLSVDTDDSCESLRPGCLAPATRPATPLGVSHCSQVCDVSRAHLPSLASALDDPRVTTHFSDGDSPARCSSLSTALTNPSALAAWFAVASSCICRAEFAVGSASATLAHLHWTWTSHHATRFVLMYVLRRCVAERAQGLL